MMETPRKVQRIITVLVTVILLLVSLSNILPSAQAIDERVGEVKFRGVVVYWFQDLTVCPPDFFRASHSHFCVDVEEILSDPNDVLSGWSGHLEVWIDHYVMNPNDEIIEVGDIVEVYASCSRDPAHNPNVILCALSESYHYIRKVSQQTITITVTSTLTSTVTRYTTITDTVASVTTFTITRYTTGTKTADVTRTYTSTQTVTTTVTRTTTTTTIRPSVPPKEARKLADIAKKQASYFRSISDFLKTKSDPSKYIDDMAKEWRSLADELLKPKPEEIPLMILLKIFKADEVDDMGKLCKSIIAAFQWLSDSSFWEKIWRTPTVQDHVYSITDKLDKLSSLYSKEADLWEQVEKGSANIEELLQVLMKEKEAIRDLKNALDSHIPAILNEFKIGPYKPLTIAEERIEEGQVREYYFELSPLPEKIDIKIEQANVPNLWEFWKTRPIYKITLKVIKVVSRSFLVTEEREFIVKEVLGTTLNIPEASTYPLLGPPEPLKCKLVVTYIDLGSDNWLTWWVDEGYKYDSIKITLKYGPEEKTYEDIYADQARSLEDFWKTLKRELDLLELVVERTMSVIMT